MQIEAFSELYTKYQDTETSPATEKYEDILFRFNQPETTYYFITADNVKVGVIRIVDCKDGVTRKRISPKGNTAGRLPDGLASHLLALFPSSCTEIP